MFQFIRRWCARLIIAAVLLLGAGVGAIYFFSESILLRYRPEIEAAIGASIGGTVKLEHVNLLILPNIKLVVRDATIHWRSPAQDLDAEATLPKLYVSVGVLPLFDRKISFRTIDLTSPSIQVTKVVPPPNLPVPIAAPPPDPGSRTPSWFSGGTSIPRIRIRNGTLTYTDGDRRWITDEFTLSSRLNFLDGTLEVPDLEARIQLLESPPGSIPAPLELSFSGAATLSPGKVFFDRLLLQARPDGLPESAAAPFSASSSHITFKPQDDLITVEQSSLLLAGTRVEGSAEIDMGAGAGKAQLTIKSLSVETAAAINRVYPVSLPFTSGSLDGTFALEWNQTDRKLSAKGIEIRKYASKSMKIDRLLVPTLETAIKTDGTGSGSASISLAGFGFNGSTGERYAAGNVDGALRASRDKKGTLSAGGDLAVVGFIYADSAVEVSKVNAKLTKISGTINKKGEANFVIPIDGTSVEVKSEAVKVLGIRSARGPITVSIPAKGYSVSGPITAEGGRVLYSGHDIAEITGNAKILITDPEKRFTVGSISGVASGDPVKLSGEMSMIADRYQFTNVAGTIFGGTLNGKVVYGRAQNQDVSIDATAKSMQLEPFIKRFFPEIKKKIAGTVETFTLGIKGRREGLLKTARGQGSVYITNGLVNELGVDGALVKVLQNIPIIGSQFDIAPAPSARGENGGFFVLRSSHPRSLKLTFTMANNAITTQDLKISSQYGTLEATGSYNFDSGFNIAGTVVFLEKTARRFAGPIKPIGNLFGALGRVEIPLTVAGAASDPRIRFDPTRTLSMTAPTRIVSSTIDEVGSALGSVGNFVLGRSTPTPQPSPEAQ